jgi:hypothetical protein
MAEASSGGGCGCGGSLKTKQVGEGKPVGNDWTTIVNNILRDGAEQARTHLQTQDRPGDGDVEVVVSMSVFLRFPHKDKELNAEEGEARCVCTNDGEVCVCYGQCDFDACCDPPDAGPIVASS